VIYLDTCLLIYLVEQHPRWYQPVVHTLENAEDARFGISPLVQCECLVGPLKRRDAWLKLSYERVFSRFLLLDMPGDVYLDAAELRAGFNLKTPDALHLACARYHSCDALWTNDERLQQAAGGLARNILR
jgi:predicted nucleic acid-binding protein